MAAEPGVVAEVAWAVAGAAARWTVLLAVAAAAARWGVRSASGRHLVWLMAVLGLLVLPVAERWVPGWRVPVAVAWWAEGEEGSGRAPGARVVAVGGEGVGVSAWDDLVTAGSDGVGWGGEGRGGVLRSGVIAAARAWPWAWAAVAALLGGLWLAGQLAVARLVRRGGEAPMGAGTAALTECARRLGVRRNVRLRLLGPDTVPMTWGVLRPVLLLPAGSTSWPDGRLRAVLLHELAHVVRLDVVVHAAARLACALFWFHPGIWYVARELRREAESACDDRVILAGMQPVDYAAELLHLARAMRAHPILSGAALPVTHGSGLERRIRAVLDESRPRRLPRRVVLPLVLATVVIIGGLAGLGRADGATGSVERAWARPAALGGSSTGWLLACGDAAGAAAVACAEGSRAALELIARTGRSGAIVAQDVRTGEVVLYAAVADSLEGSVAGVPLAPPASLVKLAVAALWWEHGLGDPERACPGHIVLPGGREIHNFASRDLGMLAVPRQMLVTSCNTAAAAMTLELIERLGESTVRSALRDFGFGSGDAPGGPPDSAFWGHAVARTGSWAPPPRPFAALGPGSAQDELAMAAVGGPNMATTPLHVSRFLQAIGNHGIAVPPRPPTGYAPPPAGTRLLSGAAASALRDAMIAVVREGTAAAIAPRLRHTDWSLGGKTGSILNADQSIDGWFAGLAFQPDGDAVYTVVVFLRNGGVGGGLPAEVAAEVLGLLSRASRAPA